MRIVFVCFWNPWLLNAGALIRNAWLIRTLATRYEVDLVTADDPSTDIPRDFAEACASISRFPRNGGFAGRLGRAFEAIRPGSSFYTSGSVAASLRQKVHELMARNGAVAIIDLRMIDALSGTPFPFVYNAHNAEHKLLSRRAEHEGEPTRSFIRLESARIRQIEARVVRNALLVAACSENDRRELIDLDSTAQSKIIVVPNGVDTHRYAAIADRQGDSRTLLITGSYDWRPNLIGLEWFLDDVLPALRGRMKDGSYSVRVAGRMKPDLAARLNRLSGVTAVPNPADITEELARAHIVVAPILASSGTRLRILEAWAAGRPVVTTSAGALGLVYRDGDDILVADQPTDFADATCRLLYDRSLWQHIRDEALMRVLPYDWARVGSDFLNRAEPYLTH